MASDELQQAKDDFIAQWGAMGSAWGINRTMAQIHALLMISPEPLSTDQIMEDLQISRGNAHSNLRDLVGWGLIRGVVRKGERKEYFEAEKDVWKVFCTILRERKRREIDPILQVLDRCNAETSNLQGEEAKVFRQQIKEINEFVHLASTTMDKVAAMSENQVVPAVMKWATRDAKKKPSPA
jgi:DNA-binding transcriptional regulator GbsR (MarR family)